MKLNIFGLQVKVQFKNISNSGFVGWYDDATQEIVISNGLKGFYKKQTFMHEFFHAVWFRSGINQSKIPHEVQEIIVEQFATAFCENYSKFKHILEEK